MSGIIARSLSGGQDLYYGVPNLDGARLVDIQREMTKDDYCIKFVFILWNGEDFTLIIKQSK